MTAAMNPYLYSCISCLLFFWVGSAAATEEGNVTVPYSAAVQDTNSPRPVLFQLTTEEEEWLQKHPVLRLGYDIDWAPVDYADEEGLHSGMSADYIALIAKLLNVTISPVPPQSWQETLQAARARKLDIISCITKTPQREEYLQFTKPYVTFPMVIVTDMEVSYISSVDMLAGKKIAVVQNYVTHDVLINKHPELNLVLVKDIQEGILKVQQGDAYAFIDGFATVSHILGNQKITDLKVSGGLPYSFDLAIAVPKGETVLAAIMQKALDSIPQSEKDEIFRRWIAVIYKSELDLVLFGQLLGVSSLILGIILYWNHKLRIEIVGRRKAEEEILKLSQAVEQSHSTIVITDLEGHIEFVNPAFSLSTGYSKEEAIGQNPRLLKSDYHDQEFYLDMWETLQAGEVWRGEMYNKRKDGSCYWEMATISPVKNREGVTSHYVAIKEDISKSKETAKELERAVATAEEMTNKAEEANLAKSSFLANMAHELRTPLNVILGYSRLLERDPQINSSQLEELKVIHRSGDHLLALINDILDISKIESGKITSVAITFDLLDFLHDVQIFFQQRCTEKGLLFSLRLDSDLPRYIKTDKGKLRQVLFNLLGNGVNYTAKGGVTLQVKKVSKDQGKEQQDKQLEIEEPLLWIHFAIIDTGMGIDPADRGNIFKPFIQAESRPITSGGTGLGLSISSNFVDLMGSKLELDSEKGVGSTFWFDLPITKANKTDIGETHTVGRPSGLMDGQREYRILVVEDHRESRLVLTAFLRGLGFTVKEAVNGEEGVEFYVSFHPDIILMDINMPVMDGLTATKKIKTGGGDASIPIIALTAHAFTEERQAILAVGCDDFIAKPYEETVLVEALKRHLGVVFTYEEELQEEEKVLNSSMFRDLPESLMEELQTATAELNQQRTLECIERIRECDPCTSNALKILADQYRFDEIRRLIEKG